MKRFLTLIASAIFIVGMGGAAWSQGGQSGSGSASGGASAGAGASATFGNVGEAAAPGSAGTSIAGLGGTGQLQGGANAQQQNQLEQAQQPGFTLTAQARILGSMIRVPGNNLT